MLKINVNPEVVTGVAKIGVPGQVLSHSGGIGMQAAPSPAYTTVGTGTVVTEVKAEPKPLVEVATTLCMAEAAPLVSEMAELWKKYEAHDMKKTVARIEAIKKELQSIANVHMDNGKKAVLADGKGNEVEFSPRTEPNEVLSPVDFVDYLTGKFDVDVAFSCVSIGMGKAQKLLGEHELAPFLHKVPGSRTLKAVRVAKVA